MIDCTNQSLINFINGGRGGLINFLLLKRGANTIREGRGRYTVFERRDLIEDLW